MLNPWMYRVLGQPWVGGQSDEEREGCFKLCKMCVNLGF